MKVPAVRGVTDHFGDPARFDIRVDLQRANHKAVGRVGTGDLQRDRLTLYERDVIGREAELARGNLDHLRRFAGVRDRGSR